MNRRNRAFFLTAVATGTMLNPLNSSMISLALHSIQKDFHLSFTTVSWLISSFYLSSAIAQPVTGKIGDLIGRKTMFFTGLLLVGISSVGAPLAPTFLLLLLMRLFQSIGSSTIFPNGMALIRDHIHEKQASALAVLAIFSSAMTALGPTLGGFLIVWGGWPTIFRVNFPFILLSFTLGLYFFPKDSKTNGISVKKVLAQMDIPGILLFSSGMVFLLWFLLSFETSIHVLSGVAGITLLILFVWYEQKVKNPFIDIRLFRSHRELSLVYLLFILLNMFNYSLFFGLPSYFQGALHYSVKTTGLLMLFMSGVSIVVSPITGRLVDRSGPKKSIVFGFGLMFIGAILLAVLFVHVPMLEKGLILSLLGISYGIGNVALQSAMFHESPAEIIGTASGLFQTCRYLGSIFSSIILGLIFGKQITSGHLEILAFVLIVIAFISVCFSLLIRGRQREAGLS